MITTPPIGNNPATGPASATGPQAPVNTGEQDPTSVRFEQLLWAELLTHTGLEKALTLGGGDGAAMFSRYFVEAIAADIAEQHPLGLISDELPASDTPVSKSEPES